eukprot:5915090-Pyramimonas_sp.AAC.1
MSMTSIWLVQRTPLTSASSAKKTFGQCKLNKNTYTKFAVIYTKDEGGSVTSGQDECTNQLRPKQHHELTGADADTQASKMLADMFVSLRSALAHALITQVWLMVYVVSL